jgi:hypothetical protein
MRENGLLSPHRVLRTEAKPHDGTIGYRTPAQVRADQCRLDQNTTADLKLAA